MLHGKHWADCSSVRNSYIIRVLSGPVSTQRKHRDRFGAIPICFVDVCLTPPRPLPRPPSPRVRRGLTLLIQYTCVHGNRSMHRGAPSPNGMRAKSIKRLYTRSTTNERPPPSPKHEYPPPLPTPPTPALLCCSYGGVRLIYGLVIGDIVPTVVTNLLGLTFSCYYCAVFAWAVEPASRKSSTYNLFAATFLVIW